MGTLTASLLGAANALDAFQYSLGVTQNNIGNASTPGYAKQVAALEALPFDPATGLAGGVSPGPTINTRDLLAERGVWQQAAAEGDASARNQALSSVQSAFPVSDGNGIPAALNAFFSAASAWSASPNDSSVRQSVIDSAGSVTQSFQTAAAAVANVSQSTDQSIHDTVDQINALSLQLSKLNAGVQNGGQHDAGLQAQIYNALETLSGLADITVLPQQDGTVTVSLGGGAPLVVGNNAYALSASATAASGQSIDPTAHPHTDIYASNGSDITSQIQSGTLHGLLEVRNVTIPELTGDSTQPGALNELAQQLAGRVNEIVGAGVQGAPGLFVTDPNHPNSAAADLSVDPNMTAANLPAADQNGVTNGVPLALAALASPPQDADKIDSVSYTQFYGDTAGQVGRELNQAQSDQDLATQLVAQARTLRQSESGVSLDEEAMHVLQFQQSYQAVAKLVTTLDNLSQAVINMIP
jgi:flagellar hook-associated protein 1 FlgK